MAPPDRMKKKKRSRDGKREEEPRQRFSKVDPETLKYFEEINGHLQTLDSDEDRQLLATNVLEETSGKEGDIVIDAACSRVLEALLPFAPIDSLCIFARNCVEGENLGKICTSGPFGSHVIEKVLIQLAGGAPGAAQSDYEAIEGALTTVTEAVESSLFDMITHKYGSFVGRRLLSIFSGIDVTTPAKQKAHLCYDTDAGGMAASKQGEQTKKSGKKQQGGLAAKVGDWSGDPNKNVDEGPLFPDLLHRIAAVALSDDFADEMKVLQVDDFAGPFLQALLRACAYDSHLQGQLVLQILGTTESGLSTFNPDTLQDLMTSRQGSHLMEVIFETSPDEIFQKLCTLSFKGRLVALAQHATANFPVQSALAALRKPQQLKRMIEDLRPQMNTLLRSRRGGVVAALLAAAGRLEAHQADCAATLWHAVQQGLGGAAGAGPLEALLTLDTKVLLGDKGQGGRLSPLGCVMCIALFKYPVEACKQWGEALLSLTPTQLADIAKDPGGCRVIETYLEGPGSAPKKRRKLLQTLTSNWAAIAGTGAGARFIEKCYAMADPSEKESITSELAAASERLAATYYGATLLRTCFVDAYKAGSGDWKKRVASADAARKEFEELFADDGDDNGGQDKEEESAEDEERAPVGSDDDQQDVEPVKKKKKKEGKKKKSSD